MKELEFIGDCNEEIRNFPAEARREAGFQLHFLQMGQDPSDWKPMKAVGTGAWKSEYIRRVSGESSMSPNF